MKLTFLTLTMAAQLAAGVAMAQTSDANTTTTGATTTGATSDSATFGSDWSTSLSAAMFGEDGTTVRSDSEIATQWVTLSEEDRNMIRRDCMVFMQGNDAASSTTDGTAGVTAGTDGSVTTEQDATAGSDTTAGTATGTDTTATPGADTTAATGTTDTGTTDTGTTGAVGGEMSGNISASDMTEVSSENMQAICAATTDL